MQKIKSVIKKISSISAGVALLGATMGGALALDLGDYPAPFVDVVEKEYNYLAVVGGAGQAADSLGVSDIVSGLGSAKVPGTSTGGTVEVAGGVSEDIPIGKNVASTNQLDAELTDSDLTHFFDGTITFQGSDYDTSEVLEFGRSGSNNVSTQSSVAGPFPDDDYEDRVVLVSSADSVKYYYRFDESININKTKDSDALEVKFLGKTLKITKVDSASKFTANVGAEYYLEIGDTVTVNGKVVELINVGSGGNVIVTVDGDQDTIDKDATKTINGLEIKNDETFYTDTLAERSAWIVAGDDATETYVDGDEYIGEDEDDPKWVWDIGNLNTEATTTITNNATGIVMGTGPFIGLESDWNYRDGSDADAIEVGGCIDLPNNYVSVCLDSLTVADDNYMSITFELLESIDLTSDSNVPGLGTANVIHVDADKEDAFKLLTSGFNPNNLSKNTDTKELWIAGGHNVSVYYKDKDRSNKKTFAGNATEEALFAEITFDDTKSSNLQLNATRVMGPGQENVAFDTVTLTIQALGDTTDDLAAGDVDHLYMNWSRTAAKLGFSSLGGTKSSEEGSEVRWGPNQDNLGTKDENHRTKYGVVVEDPKSNGASDRVELLIPGDQLQGNVVVKGTAGGTTAATTSGIAISSYIGAAPGGVLDTEVTNPADHNLILVGGPAVNSLSAQFLGVPYPSYGAASGLAEGEAILSWKDNAGKVALVVAGWESDDTRRAATVLKDYEAHLAELDGKAEVIVTGTSASPTIVSSA